MSRFRIKIFPPAVFFVLFFISATAQDIKFSQISSEQGLSQASVNCILQDSKGTIWIGTHGGLNAYSPSIKHFVRFQNDFNIPNSISSNVIKSIYLDKQ